MSFEIIRPWVLLLLPLVVILMLYTRKYIEKMFKGKRRTIIAIRSTVFVLLILALAGISFKWNLNKTTTIFLVDASDSTLAKRTEAEKFMRQAMGDKPSTDNIGIVTFGDNALVEQFISTSSSFDKIDSKPVSTYTNIENALSTAMALIPENNKKRIVLISDGEENMGSSNKLIPSIQEQNIDLKVYKIEKSVGEEVAVDSLSTPDTIRLGEEFSITATISSTVNTSASVNLYSGRERTASQKVALQKGENKFVFKDVAKSGGFKDYKVTVDADKDTEVKNNEASAFINIKDKPRVLVIEDRAGESDELTKLLAASNIEYYKTTAQAAPRSLKELTTYKSIISCNVSAENFNMEFLNSLESYVKDFGGGFVATGGDNSFAVGGYFKTPLEKILPVDMDTKGKKEIPDMAIMLVIDKSGSMESGSGGVSKVELAKEAAIRSLQVLRDRDEIGVIAFDSQIYNVVNLQKAKDREGIKKSIGSIRADGGTSILPALGEATQELKKSGARIKHIILLTDGQAETAGYDDVLADLNKNNITVSTVAVGADADQQLLKDIAKRGVGRFYATDAAGNIPSIFAKEIYMASKAYINNREFTPVINSSHEILATVAGNGLPPLLGYVASSAKDNARVLLKSDEDDPILTVWQYGLGKTVAWNSDISGKWSANYINWDKNMKLWQNIINWTVDNYGDQAGTVESSFANGKGTVTFTAKNANEELDTKAVIISPSLESKEITLYPLSPGKYSGSFDIKETGAFIVNVRQSKDGQVVAALNTGVALQYSPEYKINAKSTVLETLVDQTGGSFIKNPAEVFKGKLKAVFGKRDMTPIFLILAIVLFLFDVAVRKLNISILGVMSKVAAKFSFLAVFYRKVKKVFRGNKVSRKAITDQGSDNSGINIKSIKEKTAEKSKLVTKEDKDNNNKAEAKAQTYNHSSKGEGKPSESSSLVEKMESRKKLSETYHKPEVKEKETKASVENKKNVEQTNKKEARGKKETLDTAALLKRKRGATEEEK